MDAKAIDKALQNYEFFEEYSGGLALYEQEVVDTGKHPLSGDTCICNVHRKALKIVLTWGVCLATIAAFAAGYLLIVPGRHYLMLAAHISEFISVAEFVFEIMSKVHIHVTYAAYIVILLI